MTIVNRNSKISNNETRNSEGGKSQQYYTILTTVFTIQLIMLESPVQKHENLDIRLNR